SVVRASEKLPSRSQVGKEDLGPLVSMCPSVGINYVAQLLIRGCVGMGGQRCRGCTLGTVLRSGEGRCELPDGGSRSCRLDSGGRQLAAAALRRGHDSAQGDDRVALTPIVAPFHQPLGCFRA